MRRHLQRFANALTKHLSRQAVAWLALFMAATGTSFAATTIASTATTPVLNAAATASTTSMSWVKISGTTGRVLDYAGQPEFTTRRTVNGTYEVSFPAYSKDDCATTATVHTIRMVVGVDEQASKVTVTTYLSYTNLYYDTDVTVMFACTTSSTSTSTSDSSTSTSSDTSSSAPSISWVKISGATGAVTDFAGQSRFTTRRTVNGMYDVTFPDYSEADCAATASTHSIRMTIDVEPAADSVMVKTYLSYTNLYYDSDVTVMFVCS